MRKNIQFLLLFLPLTLRGQEITTEKKPEIQRPEIPVLLYGSGFYSQFRREGQPTVKPSPGWDIGAGMEFPFGRRAGFRYFAEIQRRSYSLDKKTEGFNNSGKRFIKTIEGRNESVFIQFPVFGRLQLHKEKKISLLAGASIGLRVKTNQGFQYRYEIPSDTIVITGIEDGGSDALDFAEFNALLGLAYRPFNRLELSLILNHKLLGFSIAKENFFSRSEQNTLLGLRASFVLIDFSRPFLF